MLYHQDPDANGEHVDPFTWDATTDAVNVSIRTPRMRYIHRSRDEDERYDHRTDRAEQRNLGNDPEYAGSVTELRSRLADEIDDTFPQVARGLR